MDQQINAPLVHRPFTITMAIFLSQKYGIELPKTTWHEIVRAQRRLTIKSLNENTLSICDVAWLLSLVTWHYLVFYTLVLRHLRIGG